MSAETLVTFNADELNRHSASAQLMFEHAIKRDYVHFAGNVRDSDTRGEEVVDALFGSTPVCSTHHNANKTEIIFAAPTLLVRLWWYTYAAEIGWDVVGSDMNEVIALNDAIDELVPVIAHDEENIVPVTFWALDAQGNPQGRTRKVGINPWDVIQNNYPSTVRAHLQELVDLEMPETGGKLVLWHGVPGTGKTHFLRALAYAWRDWCYVSYVVDPEQMFERAYYLMHVILSSEQTDRWHLIVLEDSGEFMLSEAKQRTGQGLSRLLNLTDGLVGQGLKLLVLMTTNEKVGKLHPAVARPGRCLAEIAFTSFSHKEAVLWTHNRDVATPPGDDVTLADLYELVAAAHIANSEPEISTGQYV